MSLTPQDLVWWSLLAGAGSVGLSVILRNTPIIRGWVAEAKKPWACNVCLPLYTTAAMVAVPVTWAGDWRLIVSYLPGYAIAYLALDKMSRPPLGPPKIPDEFFADSEEET